MGSSSRLDREFSWRTGFARGSNVQGNGIGQMGMKVLWIPPLECGQRGKLTSLSRCEEMLARFEVDGEEGGPHAVGNAEYGPC